VLVFEVACEAVVPSRRHKAGVTVRAPRLVRWRRESRAAEAATLAALRELVEIE
jgi:DNA ligase 1